MTGLVIALAVIVTPGVLILILVPRHGPIWGALILAALLIWVFMTVNASENARNIPIQPEIFGGQTIGHSRTGGFREMFWAAFVLGPATVWAALALLIGWFSWRRSQAETPS